MRVALPAVSDGLRCRGADAGRSRRPRQLPRQLPQLPRGGRRRVRCGQCGGWAAGLAGLATSGWSPPPGRPPRSLRLLRRARQRPRRDAVSRARRQRSQPRSLLPGTTEAVRRASLGAGGASEAGFGSALGPASPAQPVVVGFVTARAPFVVDASSWRFSWSWGGASSLRGRPTCETFYSDPLAAFGRAAPLRLPYDTPPPGRNHGRTPSTPSPSSACGVRSAAACACVVLGAASR